MLDTRVPVPVRPSPLPDGPAVTPAVCCAAGLNEGANSPVATGETSLRGATNARGDKERSTPPPS